MNKKILFLSSALLVPVALTGCSLFKTDKDVVMSAISNFDNTNNRAITSSYDFNYENDWSFSFLNNSVVSVNQNFLGDNFDASISSSTSESTQSSILDVNFRNDKFFVETNSLLEQIGGELNLVEGKNIDELKDAYISDFSSEDFSEFFNISTIPFDDLLKNSTIIPKEKFLKIENTGDDSPYILYSLELNKSDIKKYLPSLDKLGVTAANFSFSIEGATLINAHYELTSDFDNDNKVDKILVYNDFNTSNPSTLDKVNKTFSLEQFLSNFDIPKDFLTEVKEAKTEENENKEDVITGEIPSDTPKETETQNNKLNN